MAVIKVKNPFTFTSYVKPACLPPQNLKFATSKPVNCVVSGWGDTTGYSEFAPVLGAAVLQFFTPKECNHLYNGIVAIFHTL